MPVDLDAIEAALVPQYDQYGRGASEWHDNIEVRARLEWLPALVAELRVLRAVAEAYRNWRGIPAIASRIDDRRTALFAVDAALDAWRAGGGE